MSEPPPDADDIVHASRILFAAVDGTSFSLGYGLCGEGVYQNQAANWVLNHWLGVMADYEKGKRNNE